MGPNASAGEVAFPRHFSGLRGQPSILTRSPNVEHLVHSGHFFTSDFFN